MTAPKTILITGATDGIGLETAKMLAAGGHDLLLHGRNPAKLEAAAAAIAEIPAAGPVTLYTADLSSLAETAQLAEDIRANHQKLDVLINNAGVYNSPQEVTGEGLEIRFAVNTIAPYLLTKRLLPLMAAGGRVINLSSAAQAPVDLAAIDRPRGLSAGSAYAQSKLAITMWSREMALEHPDGPVIVAVNPGSLLGSKMVKQAFGIAGGELSKGADILCRAALSEEFAEASGQYFDNDSNRFAPPHPEGLDRGKSARVVAAIEDVLAAKAPA